MKNYNETTETDESEFFGTVTLTWYIVPAPDDDESACWGKQNAWI